MECCFDVMWFTTAYKPLSSSLCMQLFKTVWVTLDQIELYVQIYNAENLGLSHCRDCENGSCQTGYVKAHLLQK